MPDPDQSTVVKMSENCSERSPSTWILLRRFASPRTGFEVRKEQLIHRVIYGVNFEQNVPKLRFRYNRLPSHQLVPQGRAVSLRALTPEKIRTRRIAVQTLLWELQDPCPTKF